MEEIGITFRSIGIIHTPFRDLSGMPIQPSAAEGVEGKVILDPALQEGLQDLEGFSHIILLYYFHQAGDPKLLVRMALGSPL